MNDLRIKFIRGEEVKYISHLDLMKAFERAIRRAGIPILYSQGFNPHPQMVFGLPLSVGVTSESEIADFEFSEPIAPELLVSRLNAQLPVGFKIIDAHEKRIKANIMATIAFASYDILICTGMDKGEFLLKVDELLQKAEISVKKEGKSGIRTVNIRPMIHQLKLNSMEGIFAGEEKEKCTCKWVADYTKKLMDAGEVGTKYSLANMFCIEALLGAGSVANLKPELLVTAIKEAIDTEAKLVKIHRTGLFVEKGGRMLDPLDNGILSGGDNVLL